MKSRALWALAMGVVLVGGYRAVFSGTPEYQVFQASGARPSGYALSDWVTLSPAQVKGQSLFSLASGVATAVHLRVALNRSSGPNWENVTGVKTAGDVATKLVAERLASGAIYLVLDRSVNGGFQGLQESEHILSQALARYGPEHENVTLIGTLPGRVGTARIRHLLERMLRTAQAKEVDSIHQPALTSLTAYSPRLSGRLRLAQAWVNLECAFAYNPGQHDTEILVGSPIITITY